MQTHQCRSLCFSSKSSFRLNNFQFVSFHYFRWIYLFRIKHRLGYLVIFFFISRLNEKCIVSISKEIFLFLDNIYVVYSFRVYDLVVQKMAFQLAKLMRTSRNFPSPKCRRREKKTAISNNKHGYEVVLARVQMRFIFACIHIVC